MNKSLRIPLYFHFLCFNISDEVYASVLGSSSVKKLDVAAPSNSLKTYKNWQTSVDMINLLGFRDLLQVTRQNFANDVQLPMESTDDG